MRLGLLLFLVPATLMAQEPTPLILKNNPQSQTGLIFSRERVFIETRVTLPAAPKPQKQDNAEAYAEPKEASKLEKLKTELRRYYFDTDIRPEQSLKLEWFHSLNDQREGRATMVVFDSEASRALPLAKIYKANDVLVIGDDGTILAILPELVLATQSKQIEIELPVKAFMFLRGGEAKALQIKPKDKVWYKLFTRNPTVLQ